jgi:hypothetical protein
MEKPGKEIEEAYYSDMDDLLGKTPEKIKDGKADFHIKHLITMGEAFMAEVDDMKKNGKSPNELDSADWGKIAYFLESMYSNAIAMKAYKEQQEQEIEHRATR